VPSFRGALSVRLVIEGTTIVIVPLITSFLLNTLTLLAPDVNWVTCIFVVDDVAQISVILIPPLAMFLWWSETAGQVPAWTLSLVKLVTPYSAFTIEDWVNHD
jgi:hypothetical protein